MGEVSGNTILYKPDRSIIDLADTLNEKKEAASAGIPPLTRESAAPELFDTDTLREEEAEDFSEEASFDSANADPQINQSNYLRYLSELRRADSELALAKAESAELVRLMDSYKEHYRQYEKEIKSLVKNSSSAVKRQLQDGSEVVNEQLETIGTLARRLKKTSASLDSRIDAEIQRLTKALSDSIEGSIKDSCDTELKKVSEATQVLYNYSDRVKQQYHRFEKLEGIKFGLFILSSVASPLALILLILNMLHIF